ncbi:MAG: deoxyribose-phosphate aldolase [Xanthomonadales bacterium]|nr:deoxyribose-phosphate aldolase [Xanthomonadales bacterium]MCC6562980.1 deoxyribose-phosphate aldolase [Xanthomonadales bacterium]
MIVSVRDRDGAPRGIPVVPVDAVGAEERAAFFAKRSIKAASKLDLLYLAIRMMDLTTLEGADTPARVRQMCRKALQPAAPALTESLDKLPGFRPIPSVAAVCVYPLLVPHAVKVLEGSGVHVASVATSFPSGQASLKTRLLDVREAVENGADEIDMVINRGAFLAGDYQQVFDEIAAVRDACGAAHLKVILETGELGTLDNVRFASDLAIAAGAHFIKTSTGKIVPAATPPVTLVMLQAIADHQARTGEKIGMKPAGGIRTAKQSIQYLCMLYETLGPDWMHPDLYRFGASALLNDVLRQIYRQYTGRYYYDKGYSLD